MFYTKHRVMFLDVFFLYIYIMLGNINYDKKNNGHFMNT